MIRLPSVSGTTQPPKKPKLNYFMQNSPYSYPITTLTQIWGAGGEELHTNIFSITFSCIIHQALVKFLICPIQLLCLKSSYKEEDESWRILQSRASQVYLNGQASPWFHAFTETYYSLCWKGSLKVI